MPPEARVRVYAHDDELRTWLADELALLSPPIDVQTLDAVQTLVVAPAELLIVGIDALTLADGERLRELVAGRGVPVIAIGTPTSSLATIPFACVLDATLTSKQFKRAVRELLAQACAAQADAHPGA